MCGVCVCVWRWGMVHCPKTVQTFWERLITHASVTALIIFLFWVTVLGKSAKRPKLADPLAPST